MKNFYVIKITTVCSREECKAIMCTGEDCNTFSYSYICDKPVYASDSIKHAIKFESYQEAEKRVEIETVLHGPYNFFNIEKFYTQ